MFFVIEHKLSKLEKEFEEKRQLFKTNDSQGLENTLMAIQKNYETRKQKELEEEVTIITNYFNLENFMKQMEISSSITTFERILVVTT